MALQDLTVPNRYVWYGAN